MGRARRRFSAEFKCKVALAAIKGERTLSELAAQFQVHPHRIAARKKQALSVLPEVFSRKRDIDEARRGQPQEELYGQIGSDVRKAQGAVIIPGGPIDPSFQPGLPPEVRRRLSCCVTGDAAVGIEHA